MPTKTSNISNLKATFAIIFFGIYKNLGNVFYFTFTYWNFETAVKYNYDFDTFLRIYLFNLNWFIPLMIMFFIFRYKVDLHQLRK